MINSKRFTERFLQNYRFSVAHKYIKGDVMDFGGNEGELKPFVKGDYTVVNYDHSVMFGKKYDTIVCLAVIEHIDFDEVFEIFNKFKDLLNKDGKIILTTPTPFAKPVLEVLSFLNIVDRENIEEHKHYWNKKEIFELANKNLFKVEKYNKFQFGFNQRAIFSLK